MWFIHLTTQVYIYIIFIYKKKVYIVFLRAEARLSTDQTTNKSDTLMPVHGTTQVFQLNVNFQNVTGEGKKGNTFK